jgi:hypothetical protein
VLLSDIIVIMNSRIESFLRGFRKQLQQMSAAEYKEAVDGLVGDMMTPDNNIGELADRWWAEVVDATLRFARLPREARAIRRVPKQRLLDFYDAFFMPPPTPTTSSTPAASPPALTNGKKGKASAPAKSAAKAPAKATKATSAKAVAAKAAAKTAKPTIGKGKGPAVTNDNDDDDGTGSDDNDNTDGNGSDEDDEETPPDDDEEEEEVVEEKSIKSRGPFSVLGRRKLCVYIIAGNPKPQKPKRQKGTSHDKHDNDDDDNDDNEGDEGDDHEGDDMASPAASDDEKEEKSSSNGTSPATSNPSDVWFDQRARILREEFNFGFAPGRAGTPANALPSSSSSSTTTVATPIALPQVAATTTEKHHVLYSLDQVLAFKSSLTMLPVFRPGWTKEDF